MSGGFSIFGPVSRNDPRLWGRNTQAPRLNECPGISARPSPLALPVIFALSGLEPDEGCIIERLETRAFVREIPAAAANHWQAAGQAGYSRGIDSEARSAPISPQVDTAGPGSGVAGRGGSAGSPQPASASATKSNPRESLGKSNVCSHPRSKFRSIVLK